jgi:hypothetical protein
MAPSEMTQDDVMTADFWSAPARLMRTADHGRSWHGARSVPPEVMAGTVATLVRHIQAQDSEDLWRFAIVTGDDHYIRNAELRSLIRREDVPAD